MPGGFQRLGVAVSERMIVLLGQKALLQILIQAKPPILQLPHLLAELQNRAGQSGRLLLVPRQEARKASPAGQGCNLIRQSRCNGGKEGVLPDGVAGAGLRAQFVGGADIVGPAAGKPCGSSPGRIRRSR